MMQWLREQVLCSPDRPRHGMGRLLCPAAIPWSLKGKTIPTFHIANKDQAPEATFSLSVVVSPTLSKEELTTVSQKIIEELPQHSLVAIVYYSDVKQMTGDFTVGKAWWGVDDDKNFPSPGDYTHHVLKVEMAGKQR